MLADYTTGGVITNLLGLCDPFKAIRIAFCERGSTQTKVRRMNVVHRGCV